MLAMGFLLESVEERAAKPKQLITDIDGDCVHPQTEPSFFTR
jgi:hypothetical protein